MTRIKPQNVKPLSDYFLEIEFSNGEKRKFDCHPYLNGDWFSELLDLEKFYSVRVSGNTIEWAGGQDICPDCLYDNSL
ncbi:MAG: DUF2442 domain-containing protein [Candidatus Kapabacteria bacterium]|nr:DUF2442 domain-containing protein [Candidatus Kapabacteria bacterium]